MKSIFAIVLCLTLSPVCAGSLQGKRILEYGNDVQNTTSVRQHVREYEAKLPFDGLVMVVSARNGLTLGWHCFSTEKLDPADFQQALDDLKNTKFEKFTDNFIQICSGAGIDWFEPNWSNVAYNASLFARVAKEGGCKGIMFDPEMYSGRLWSYVMEDGKPRPGHTFQEYRAKARERGHEFIRAINKEFPDITLLCLFGPSLLYLETGGEAARLEAAPNVLLSAFYDGVCEAATPQTVLVDGYENAYTYRERTEFVRGRSNILVGAKKLSLNPKPFKKHVRVGFGICPEAGLWNPADYSKNYLTPAGFRAAANYALELSDRYVWVYSGGMHWLDGTPPKEYLDALRLSKEGPGPGEKHPIMLMTTERKRYAEDEPGYSDEETFAEMRKTMTEVYDFPKDGWLFAFDKHGSGRKHGWYRSDFNDSNWRPIMIGKWWEEQVEAYNGKAWYRKHFTAPTVKRGKRIFVVVGGADDWAKVWLNGTCVGEQHLPIAVGWNTPFALDVTKVIKPGKENVLAIRVEDPGAFGGLWKSVKLMEK
ncbi:MAG: beta galactosidase jelly roll domain-containing protein [Armatimonadota bacterium]|nr:beta galactosidase jelly roll domain-containing protein [Armatimonadota bacterium]